LAKKRTEALEAEAAAAAQELKNSKETEAAPAVEAEVEKPAAE